MPGETLLAAVALNGISFIIARGFGPAIGGIVVAAAGWVAAFATNALFYLPLLAVLFFWDRVSEPPRLSRERLSMLGVFGVGRDRRVELDQFPAVCGRLRRTTTY